MDFVPKWPTCEVADCSGVQAGDSGRCLEHSSSDEMNWFLARLAPGSDLDVRGTTIDILMLPRLLEPFKENGIPVLGDVQFDFAEFDVAIFDGMRFAGRAGFEHALFNAQVSFREVRFEGSAIFRQARFEKGGLFNGAVFVKDVSYNGAEFRELAALSDAVIETESRLVFGRAERLYLDRARFVRSIDLSVDVGSVHCDEAQFESGMTLWLGRGAIYAARTMFGGPSTLSGDDCRLLTLRGTDVGNLSLTGLDLSQCDFARTHRLDQIRIEGRCSFAVLKGRQIIAEEAFWRDRLVGLRAENLAVLYRSLRKSLADSKNEAGAGDFYYGEMEMRRLSSETRRAERLILWFYWLLSGYGQRAGRALLALLVLITTVAVLLAIWGQPPAEAAQIAVGAVVLRDPGTRLTEAGQWTVMVARVLGPVLLALAVLAIRARVKR